MSNRWVEFSLNFSNGLNQKVDPKALNMGYMEILENGVFERFGILSKRPGNNKYPYVDQDFNNISDPRTIALREFDPVLTAREGLYSFLGDRFRLRSTYEPCVPTKTAIPSTIHEQSNPSKASTNGVTLYAWSDSRGGVRYMVISDLERVIYIDDTQAHASASYPRCVAIGGYLYLFYADTAATDVNFIRVNSLDPSATPGSGTCVSDLHADEVFDVCLGHSGTYALIAYQSTRVNDVVLGYIGADGVVDHDAEVSGGTVNPHAISVASKDGQAAVGFLWTSGTQQAVITRWDVQTDSITFDTSTADTTNVTSSVRITVGLYDSEAMLLWENGATDPENHYCRFLHFPNFNQFGTSSAGLFSRHAGLGSKIFLESGKPYVILQSESALGIQNVYLLYRVSTTPGLLGFFEYGQATALTSSLFIPESFLATVRRRARLSEPSSTFSTNTIATTDNINYTSSVLNDYTLAFGHPKAIEYARNLYYPGAMLWSFDGRSAYESGFIQFPEPAINVGQTSGHTFISTGAGNVDVGVHGYRVYAEWFNSLGQKERSAALEFSLNVTSASKVTMTLPNLAHTRKSDVYFVVFRTVKNGTQYFRVTSLDPSATGDNGFYFNDKTADSWTFADNLADSDILDNELDTQGSGVIANTVPPGCSLVAATKRRVFLAGGSLFPNEVRYSKLPLPNTALEFSDRLSIQLPIGEDPITALGTLNDRLVIFTSQSIYMVAGDGPNNLGLGDFQEPVRISSDVGASTGALAETPAGLFFVSAKGIYLLNQNGQVLYVGSLVENYTQEHSYTSAVIRPNVNQILFFSETGDCLVFAYDFQQWSVFTNHKTQSAFGDYFVGESGLFVRSLNHYLDGNQPYGLRVKTGPIRLGALQERFQVRRGTILATWLAQHSLDVKFYIGRHGAPRDSFSITPENFLDTSTWGDDTTWGNSSPWGGTGVDYQFSIAPSEQYCQSFALEILEKPGQHSKKTIELSEMLFEVAKLPGAAKLSGNRRK